ncbi:MAG: DUF5110 domain-containing protein, partial [Bacteroidales bacterium]|nr:DUF5110 domain-containing protein [Bacteroidales bacterium]
HYEDDGVSQAYPDEYATTLIEKTVKGRTMTVVVNPRQGTYSNALQTRALSIVLEGVKDASAEMDGQKLETVQDGRSTTVILPETSVSSKAVVRIMM